LETTINNAARPPNAADARVPGKNQAKRHDCTAQAALHRTGLLSNEPSKVACRPRPAEHALPATATPILQVQRPPTKLTTFATTTWVDI